MTDFDAISSTYRAALPPGRISEMPLHGIDRLGVPFHVVNFAPEDGPPNSGSGYGTSVLEARMGALGELTEVVLAHRAVQRMPRERASYAAMVRRHGTAQVLDPLRLCLEAGSAYHADLPLQWVQIRRYRSDEHVWVPLEFVACQGVDIGPGPWLITPITNGLGAGLTSDSAVAHGLLELIQRDGNSVTFRALAADLAVALDEVRDEQTRSLLAHLDAQGVDVVVKLAGTDFGMANLYAVGIDRKAGAQSPIMALACGEAAHPNREHALRKALLEFVSARSRIGFSHGPLAPVAAVTPPEYLHDYLRRYDPSCDEPRALQSMHYLHGLSLDEMRALLEPRVLAARRAIPFGELPHSVAAERATREELADLVAAQLRAAGFDILVADFTPPGSAVHAVKVLVPGLEVETMSYHRIGVRNLRRLMAQPEGLAGVGDPPPQARRVLLPATVEAELGGAAWLDVAALDRVVGPLYAIYREPARHAAALRSQIYIADG